MQIKTIMNFDFIFIRMAEKEIVKIPDAVEHTNWMSHTVLVGMLNGTASLGESLEISNKVKHTCIIQPSNCTPAHSSPRSETLCWHKTSYSNVLSSFICNS